MKKIFTLLSLMFVMSMMSLQCWADDAEVKFGGTELEKGKTYVASSPGAGQVQLGGLSTGTVTYSADGTTLTLENVTQPNFNYSGVIVTNGNLKIILKGANTTGNFEFNCSEHSYTHSIESEDGLGSLTIQTGLTNAIYLEYSSMTIKNCTVDATAKTGYDGVYGWRNGPGTGSSLTIDNATFKALGTGGSIYGIESLTLIGCSFTAPSGAHFYSNSSGTKFFVTKNDDVDPTTEQVVIQPSVTLNANGYATFSSLTEVAVPSTVAAYTATVDETAKSITWTKIAPEEGGTTIIPAKEGVLIKGTANATAVLAASATSKAKSSTNQLKPNLTAMTNTASSHIYVLSGSDIKLLAETGTLKANKAYFQLTQDVTTSSDAKGFTYIWNDDEATAINEVPGTSSLVSGTAYNLTGQRVNASHKGIVIKDGKKYVVK